MLPSTRTIPAACPPALGEVALHADLVGAVDAALREIRLAKYNGIKKLLVRNCADGMPLRGSDPEPVLRDLEALFIVIVHCPLYVFPGREASTFLMHECSMTSWMKQ